MNALLLGLNLVLLAILTGSLFVNLHLTHRYLGLLHELQGCVFMLKGLIGQAIISRTEPRLARVATLLGQTIRVDVSINSEDQGGA